MLFYLVSAAGDDFRTIANNPALLALLLDEGFKLISKDDFFTQR